MAQKIVKHVKDMVAEANKEVEITPVVDASKYFEDSKYVFVDIRDPREIQREGKIPNSFSCPRGMLEFWIDPDSPYHKEIFNQDKKYVFYCAAAGRSALAAKAAQDMGLSPVSYQFICESRRFIYSRDFKKLHTSIRKWQQNN